MYWYRNLFFSPFLFVVQASQGPHSQHVTVWYYFQEKKTPFTKNAVGQRILFILWLHTTVILFMEESSKLPILMSVVVPGLWCATHLSAVVIPALQAARALLVPVTVALARLAGLGLGAAPALVNLPPRAAQCWPIINICSAFKMFKLPRGRKNVGRFGLKDGLFLGVVVFAFVVFTGGFSQQSSFSW